MGLEVLEETTPRENSPVFRRANRDVFRLHRILYASTLPYHHRRIDLYLFPIYGPEPCLHRRGPRHARAEASAVSHLRRKGDPLLLHLDLLWSHDLPRILEASPGRAGNQMEPTRLRALGSNKAGVHWQGKERILVRSWRLGLFGRHRSNRNGVSRQMDYGEVREATALKVSAWLHRNSHDDHHRDHRLYQPSVRPRLSSRESWPIGGALRWGGHLCCLHHGHEQAVSHTGAVAERRRKSPLRYPLRRCSDHQGLRLPVRQLIHSLLLDRVRQESRDLHLWH
mmetsp:Transcript_17144/g.29644  ORF Transcript_17144/g.29644 Transcript_17144/m.29644 type:complete len:282 (+) Transcript_17144:452-1297(+)